MVRSRVSSEFWRVGKIGLVAMLSIWGAAGCGKSDDKTITAANSQFQVADGNKTNDPATSGTTFRGAGQVTDPANANPNVKGPSDPSPATPVGNQVPVPKPPVVPAADLSELRVPDGGKEALLAFGDKIDQRIQNLLQGGGRGLSREGLIQEVQKLYGMQVEACDKLMAIEGLDAESRLSAIKKKTQALTTLVRTGDSKAEEQYKLFAAELAKDADPKTATQGQLILFGMNIEKLANGDIDDPAVVVDGLKSILLKDGLGKPEFSSLQDAAQGLVQLGFVAEGKEAIQLISDRFKNHEDKELAADANKLTELLPMIEFQVAFMDTIQDKEGGAEMLLAAANKIVANGANVESFRLLTQFAMQLEFSGNVAAVKPLYELIGKKFVNGDDPALSQQATDILDKALRRLDLIGKPLEIVGVDLKGNKLDWAKLKGKVVLVDFWASWCGPCIQELPNLKENYEKFHAKGFEIVGVNLDDDHPAAVQAAESHEMSWLTVRSADPNQAAFKDPNAVKCGVEAIPFLVLIGADGNVAALHTRGSKLGEKLTEMLGGGEEAKEPEKASGAQLNRRRDSSSAFVGAFEADEKADDRGEKAAKESSEKAAEEDTSKLDFEKSNPYLAPQGLSDLEIAEFIFDMQDKPKSIQRRAGFTEAVVEACDRLFKSDKKEKYQLIAAEAKFEILHKDACLGDEKADKLLMEFVEQVKDDAREKIAQRVKFLLLERRAIEGRQTATRRDSRIAVRFEGIPDRSKTRQPTSAHRFGNRPGNQHARRRRRTRKTLRGVRRDLCRWG